MRSYSNPGFLKNYFNTIKNVYVYNVDLLTDLNLKPYELHIYDLIRKESRVEMVLRLSELLESDTLQILYTFYLLELISFERGKTKPFKDKDHSSLICSNSFNSFEEALRHYNAKYELIYRVLLKEIGPISLSILFKAIEDICDNLPTYMQKVRFDTNGGIDKEVILKNLWYQDFENTKVDFLRSLEEILYAEIYVVKKHLGVDSEQQVLRWINNLGN
jgi:hypothetical protein